MSMRSGPGYTVNDLVYWSGFIAGTATTYLAIKTFELHHILALLISLAVGVALGAGLEYLYRQSKKPPRPPVDESRPFDA